MADLSKKESKAKVAGEREGLWSKTCLTPDQAEPVVPWGSESPEREHEATESDAE